MSKVTHPNFTVNADMFDYAEGSMTTNVSAIAVPEDYDSDRYHFYCSACAQDNHFARLKPVKAQTRNPSEDNPQEKKSNFDAPARYNLVDHKDSTHRCTQASRYRAIDLLAHRYNAGRDGAHQYEFSDTLKDGQTPAVITNEIKTVDRASRLAKIAYFLMYDQELMAQQRINLAGVSKGFREGFFDASKADKIEIFNQALAATSIGTAFRTAMIFQPNPYLPAWKENESKNGIPGTMGPNVALDGSTIRPINMLWCENARTYYDVKRMADRGNGFSPLLVMGDAMISVKRLEEAKNKSRHAQKAETVFTVLKVNNPSQVTTWDFDVKFEEAAANQNKVQEFRRAKMARAAKHGSQFRFDL